MAQTPHQPFEMNTGDVGGFADECEKRADLSSRAWRPLERPLVSPSERAEELPRNLANRPRLRMLHLRCQNLAYLANASAHRHLSRRNDGAEQLYEPRPDAAQGSA